MIFDGVVNLKISVENLCASLPKLRKMDFNALIYKKKYGMHEYIIILNLISAFHCTKNEMPQVFTRFQKY